ncbi:hypothetical protein ACFCWX_46490, partial [Streptomyces sp. NPDC056405]
MPAVRNSFRIATLIALASVPVIASPTAFAGGRGEGGTRGSTDQRAEVGGDGTVSVTVGGVVFDRSKNGSGDSAGALASSTSWSPPPCWYAPKYTPEQLQEHLEPIWEAGST